jgi:phospholipid-binding lipoprotein MlaA
MRRRCLAALTTLLLLAAGCAPRATRNPQDPLEPLNRKIFAFNDKVDVYFVEPVARGWDWLLPDGVQRAIRRFGEHIDFPIYFVNDLLQGKLQGAGNDLARFVVNTTAGGLGFFDPAAKWGITSTYEDTGQTFGVWGIPGGPYLVIPFYGPSTPRDLAGLAGDWALAIYPFLVQATYVTTPFTAVELINLRSLYLAEVRTNKEQALDYYAFVRNAYLQRRRAQILDTTQTPAAEEEDLYETEPDTDE